MLVTWFGSASTYFCFTSPRIKAKAHSIIKSFAFNAWFILILQSYLDILSPSSIQLMYFNKGHYFELFSGTLMFVRTSQVICILALPISVGLLYKYRESIANSAEHPSFSVLYEDFKNDEGLWSMMYYPLFMLRRILYVACLLYLYELDVVLGLVCTILCIPVSCKQSFAFLLHYNPYKRTDNQNMALYVEGCGLLTFVLLNAYLTDLNESAKFTYNLLVKMVVGSIYISSIALQLYSMYLKLAKIYQKIKLKFIRRSKTLK